MRTPALREHMEWSVQFKITASNAQLVVSHVRIALPAHSVILITPTDFSKIISASPLVVQVGCTTPLTISVISALVQVNVPHVTIPISLSA